MRLQPAAHGYEPTEIREFKAAFNKAAEELSGTELLRKDFVNNFSHEFKTPIVSISGFADLLLDEDVTPEEQREYLQIIRDESKRLAQLSGGVLLLNRIEAQTILTDCTDFSLDEQLRQCILVTRQSGAISRCSLRPSWPLHLPRQRSAGKGDLAESAG